MTKKDYELIAAVLLANVTGQKELGFERIVESLFTVAEELATEFEVENPRFQRQRFLLACGVKR